MKIIIINGTAESGKDTFVRIIKESNPSKIFNLSTIDPSKNALLTLGWDGKTKNEETRQAMVDLKRISIRLFNGPFNYIANLIGDGGKDNIFFVHCREPEEIKKFVKYYKKNCITLLIKRLNSKVLKNGADDIVEKYKYDYVINNNNTLNDLKNSAIKFINKYLTGE